MQKINLTNKATFYYNALKLIQNYQSGIDAHLGVNQEFFFEMTNMKRSEASIDFMDYLYRNSEAELYLTLSFGREIPVAHGMKLFPLKPELYVSHLNHMNETNTYNYSDKQIFSDVYTDMMDSFFEELTTKSDKYIFDSYLPKRHENNINLIKSLYKKQSSYARYVVSDSLLVEMVKDEPSILGHKTSRLTGATLLMRQLCKANPLCAEYACSPLTTKAGVLSSDTTSQKVNKVNHWLASSGERKFLKNASGGGMPRVKTVAAPKPKFKI